MVNAENVDPNADEASSRASSRASSATAYTSPSTLPSSVGSAADLEQRRRQQPLGRRSISGASSTSSGSKRRCDYALEARGEKRRCIEFEERLAEYEARLAEEIKRRETLERMLEASEKRAQRFMNKYHHRFRSLTMWRLRAHRAKSALRALWVTGKDGNSTRARPVLVQKGGKRRAIQRQVIVESGSLQPRQSGVGGTEYTTRERLLAWLQDVGRGISSRHDASERNNADRVRRQLEAAVIMHPRSGRSTRRHNSAEAVDLFARPSERTMRETRLALHLLAACELIRKSSSALAINISADGKQFGRFPTLGASVEIVTAVPDEEERSDAFGSRQTIYVSNLFRPPIMQNAGKAVLTESLVRRKDGGQYEPQTALTLSKMLVLCGVDKAIKSNISALRMATDAATDNRGGGPEKATMDHMSGNNSLMDKLMIRGDVWPQAEAYLESLGLLKPIQQFFDGEDLPGLLEELVEKRLKRERVERGNANARSAAKRALKNIAGVLEAEACHAEARVASLDRIFRLGSTECTDLNAVRETLAAAAAKAKEARNAANLAKQRAMEAGKRHCAPSSAEAAPAVASAAAAAGAPSGADSEAAPAVAPAAAAAGAPSSADAAPAVAPAAAAAVAPPRLQRVPLNMSGPVQKCRKEQERLFRLRIYEVLLRPALKWQRCLRWMLNLWEYRTHEGFPHRQHDDEEIELSKAERLARKQALFDQNSMVRSRWAVHGRCEAFARSKRMQQIDACNTALYGNWIELFDADVGLQTSKFWKPRPTGAAHGVSMAMNPSRFWPCVNHLPGGADSDQRCEAGTTCHCKEHRLANFSKVLVRSLDPGVTVNLGVVAHAVHSNDLGVGLSDAIDALLNPDLADNPHTDFFKRAREAVDRQHALRQGPSMEVAMRDSGVNIVRGQAVKLEIDKPNEARWISIYKLAHDVSRGENWLAIGLLRAKGFGCNEEAEVGAAAAILSYRGFVPDEHATLDIDPSKRHLFRILVSPQAKESRYMMAALYQLVLHPILALTGDVNRSAKMNGVSGLPRRLLLVIQHVIWRSTAPREVKRAIAHRTDVEILYEKHSMRFINPACGEAIRHIIGDDLPEVVRDEMVDAIPTLLRRIRCLAMMPGRVVPDTTRMIFAFMFDYLYDSDGSLKDRCGNKVEETFAIKMSQMQLHFRMVIKDAVFGLRDAFAREISSPSSFAAGASWEVSSVGTVNGKHILSPHPSALANVVVMRVMGRDIVAHMKEQLLAKGGALADQHPLDFFPAIAFMWSKNGTKSSIEFTGMTDPAKFEFKDPHDETREENGPVEPCMLQGKLITSLIDRDGEEKHSHWQSLASLGPFAPVRSQTTETATFSRPIQWYPYLEQLVHHAAAASSSSKNVETDWGRLSMFHGSRTNLSFASLREHSTNTNGVTMGLNTEAIEENDTPFKVGVEIARLPGWLQLDMADKLLREAMHADYKRGKAKKGRRSCGESTLNGSYRGDRWAHLTKKEKTAVLNNTLRVCAVNGVERDPEQVDAFRLQLGLPPATARPLRRRAQRQRQDAENQEQRRSPSPPPSHHALSPPPPSPPPQQQAPPPPAPAAPTLAPSPLPSLSQGKDGGADEGSESSDLDVPLSDRAGRHPRLAGTCGDGDGVALSEFEGDGDDPDEDESEESEESEIEFADNLLDKNTQSIAFVYDTFNACTPAHPKNSDNIWQYSNVTFRELLGVKTASVTRKPTEHLLRLLETFDPIPAAGMQFTVHMDCNHLRYIFRQSWSGCVVVKVHTFSPPEGGDWSKTMQIRRVMPTDHAIQECQARSNEGVHLGKPDLQTFRSTLKKFQRESRPWTVGSEVYHESDVVEYADIRELIGVVRSYPFNAGEAPASNHFKSPYDYHDADLIYIGPPFRQTIRGKAIQRRVVDRPAVDAGAGGAASTIQDANARRRGRGREPSAGAGDPARLPASVDGGRGGKAGGGGGKAGGRGGKAGGRGA